MQPIKRLLSPAFPAQTSTSRCASTAFFFVRCQDLCFFPLVVQRLACLFWLFIRSIAFASKRQYFATIVLRYAQCSRFNALLHTLPVRLQVCMERLRRHFCRSRFFLGNPRWVTLLLCHAIEIDGGLGVQSSQVVLVVTKVE